MKKRLLTALFSLVLLAACSSAPASFAVKVNDQAVPMQDYDDFYSFYQTSYEQLDYDWEGVDKEQLKQSILETLIQDELLRQLAEEKNWDLQTPEVDGELDQLKTQITTLGFPTYDDWLLANHRTDEKMRTLVAFQQNISQDEGAVAPEVLQQYFDDNAAAYDTPEMVTASHILIDLEDEAKAYQLAADLQGADLETFAETARKESIDTGSAADGGSVGSFGRGQMVTEFEDAAFSQEIGVVSAEPVQSRFGYHIIYVQDHQPAKQGVLEDNIEQIRVMTYYTNLRENARIEYGEGMAPPSEEDAELPVEEITFSPDETTPDADETTPPAETEEDAAP
ncbi:MAG: peptidylprolyl isomerase [Gracilibacteraceae bacterium]|jgi:peptidyl-prolyl cis-trans isomerase C|nr:peptidylprolyl isomerase [Gracilibacteraceae bacterium]